MFNILPIPVTLCSPDGRWKLNGYIYTRGQGELRNLKIFLKFRAATCTASVTTLRRTSDNGIRVGVN